MSGDTTENTGLTFKDLRNESHAKFVDISTEKYRIYHFPNDKSVCIDEPVALAVAKSGGHRLLDVFGRSHYVPKGWVHLQWSVKEGAPHFVK